MKEQKIVHGHQKGVDRGKTLCGKKWGVWEPEETSIEIPEGPRGIADPNWITCPECRKKLALPDMTKAFVL